MLSLHQQQQEVLNSVKETRIGIAPEDQDKIYRVDRVRLRKTVNAELRLVIAKAITKAHNGKINITSKLNTGSTFEIYLPISE